MRLLWLKVVLVAGVTGACRPMSEEEYVRYLTEAHEALTIKQARLESTYRLGTYQRFDYDQGTRQIVFSDSGVAQVVAGIQIVGHVSKRDSSWLWAWANPSVEPALQGAARKARRTGWWIGIEMLRQDHWPADQVDGWEMTSLTAQIAGADGAYRAPDSDSTGYTFLLLQNVRWARAGERVVDGLLPREQD